MSVLRPILAGFLLIGLFAPAEASITETSSIVKTLEGLEDQPLVLVNLTNTLYTANNTLGRKEWRDYLSAEIHKVISQPQEAETIANFVIGKIVHIVPKELIEPESAQAITHLQERGIPVLGVTRKQLSTAYAPDFGDLTVRQIGVLGIDFSRSEESLPVPLHVQDDETYNYRKGVLFLRKSAKEHPFLTFLQKIHYRPSKVILIENDPRNLEEYEELMKREKIPFLGILYQKPRQPYQDPMNPIIGLLELIEFNRTGRVLQDPEVEYEAKKLTTGEANEMLRSLILFLEEELFPWKQKGMALQT